MMERDKLLTGHKRGQLVSEFDNHCVEMVLNDLFICLISGSHNRSTRLRVQNQPIVFPIENAALHVISYLENINGALYSCVYSRS